MNLIARLAEDTLSQVDLPMLPDGWHWEARPEMDKGADTATIQTTFVPVRTVVFDEDN